VHPGGAQRRACRPEAEEAAQQAGACQRKLGRAASATAHKQLQSKMRVNDAPSATLQKVRELTQLAADK
jgi:hypothetical protein